MPSASLNETNWQSTCGKITSSEHFGSMVSAWAYSLSRLNESTAIFFVGVGSPAKEIVHILNNRGTFDFPSFLFFKYSLSVVCAHPIFTIDPRLFSVMGPPSFRYFHITLPIQSSPVGPANRINRTNNHTRQKRSFNV